MSGKQPQDANYAEYNTTAANGADVNLSGRVTGVVTENPIPDISVVFNGWEPEYYQADTDKVDLDKALGIKAPNENTVEAGDVLTADFSLGDNEYNNVSVVRWYRVGEDGDEKLVKWGVAQFDRSYTVTEEDKGFQIKVSVFPETVSGYTAAEQTAAVAVSRPDTVEPSPSPEDAGEKFTPVPEDEGEKSTPVPEEAGEKSTPVPGDEGEKSTPSPEDAGEEPSPSPEDIGANGSAEPAGKGASSTPIYLIVAVIVSALVLLAAGYVFLKKNRKK